MPEKLQQQEQIKQRIEIDRVDLLFDRTKVAMLTIFVVCTLYLWLISSLFSIRLICFWYAVFTVGIIGRLWLLEKYLRHRKNEISPSLDYWLKWFRLGIFITGLTVGSLNVFFYPLNSPPHQLLAVMFPVGVMAGAVTMLPDLISFVIYLSTLMVPVIVQIMMMGDSLHFGDAALLSILAFFFIKFSREFTRNFTYSMRLRYENQDLVEDLEFEKNRLNNRLGRILNDSSTEIFVVAADTLNCIQVNMGAIENLGYSESEFTRVNLLDIFVGLNRDSLAELTKPLYDGSQGTVYYGGLSKRQDLTTYPIEARLQLSTVEDPPILIVNVQDVSERAKWEDKLVYQANYDQLTGLYNRHYMQFFMDSALVRARRVQHKVVLLFLDLDNFKAINDTLGHDAGDEVLKQTAQRIRMLLRESDTPARTGGDEFTVMLEGLKETGHAEIIARKLVEMFTQPFVFEGREIFASASIGISVYPDDGKTLDQIMKYADMAMYQTKECGRNNYRFFSQEMCRVSEEQVLITNHLRSALANGEFSLAYQPKVDIVKGRIVGAEALLRWHSPELGEVPPGKFISLAEKMGFIESIGSWVLETACCEACHWQNISPHGLRVAVNVSPQQFRAGTLFDTVENVLHKSGLPANLLELEITESLLLQDSDKPLNVLQCLSDRGVNLALDDFGTGYSSLSYLKRFPLQVLKIDRSFIRDLENNESNRVLVKAIIAMAQSLKLEIVAEGIEKEEQLIFLRQHQVNLIQGYYFSPAIPADKFRDMLQNWSYCD